MSAPAPLDRRLTLEAPDDAPDGGGGALRAWRPLGVHWAAVRALSAREGVENGAEGARLSHRIEIRWAPPGSPARPNAAQRFREGARVFHIRAVAEADPARRRLICWAEEDRAR